jgi:hypothetical protein
MIAMRSEVAYLGNIPISPSPPLTLSTQHVHIIPPTFITLCPTHYDTQDTDVGLLCFPWLSRFQGLLGKPHVT